jgi:hypothetical protein
MSEPQPPPRKGQKVPHDQVRARLAYVEAALAALTPSTEVIAGFRATFGTGERCAEKYLQRVRARWDAEGKAEADRAAKRDEIERAADVAFRVAMAERDTRAMVAALNLKAQLHGLLKTVVTGPNGGPVQAVIFIPPEDPADG